MSYQTCNGVIYVIKPGDTIYKIGQHYGVPTAKILRANPYINIYNLQIGSRICVPTEENADQDNCLYYTAGENESIKTILDATGMNFAEFLAMNPLGCVILQPGLEIAVKRREKMGEEDTQESKR